MTRKERLACLDRAKELEMALPDGAAINSVSLINQNVLLYGKIDFRDFAESMGAEVTASHYVDDESDFISLHAGMFGFDVSVIIYPDDPRFARELPRCARQ